MAFRIPTILGPITQVDTAPLYPLGALYEEPPDNSSAPSAMGSGLGGRTWRYVYNDDASTAWAVGNPIVFEAAKGPGYGRQSTTSTLQGMQCIGVAQHAIAAGSYGWILADGVGEVLACSDTIDANEAVYLSDNTAGCGREQGAVTISVTDNGPIAWALEDAAAAATATCVIRTYCG
jgi:hypothetical protein